MEPADGFLLSSSDWALSASSNSRDRDFHGIVLEHYDREQLSLRKYALFLGIDRESAEDIVQESFLKLYEHLQRDGDQSNLRAWLYRVVHNLARNRQTASGFRKTDTLSGLTGAAEPVATSPSPEHALIAEERDANLERAMRELSPAQRECLALRAQGLKYREMADVLQLSVSTVAESVQRGLEKLRKAL